MARTATTSSTALTEREPRGLRGPFPARTVHLVDIENLADTGVPAPALVAAVRGQYARQVGVGAMDHVIIGCNHLALPGVGRGWPGARYLVRSGPDGADRELLDVIARENIIARFTGITIGSGDGAFAWAAACLAAAGCRVTVASRPEALSKRLALAAHHVIRLHAPGAATAVPAALRPGAA